MTSLSNLRARVEGAEGPSRKLDVWIWKATAPDEYRRDMYRSAVLRPRGQAIEDFEPGWAVKAAPPYTASLDAALALVERVLPGRDWSLTTDLWGKLFMATIWKDAGGDIAGEAETRSTPALALLAALLRALESTEAGG
jgi:hypothetical protein